MYPCVCAQAQSFWHSPFVESYYAPTSTTQMSLNFLQTFNFLKKLWVRRKKNKTKTFFLGQAYNITYLAEISGCLLLVNTTYFNKELVIRIFYKSFVIFWLGSSPLKRFFKKIIGRSFL